MKIPSSEELVMKPSTIFGAILYVLVFVYIWVTREEDPPKPPTTTEQSTTASNFQCLIGAGEVGQDKDKCIETLETHIHGTNRDLRDTEMDLTNCKEALERADLAKTSRESIRRQKNNSLLQSCMQRFVWDAPDAQLASLFHRQNDAEHLQHVMRVHEQRGERLFFTCPDLLRLYASLEWPDRELLFGTNEYTPDDTEPQVCWWTSSLGHFAAELVSIPEFPYRHYCVTSECTMGAMALLAIVYNPIKLGEADIEQLEPPVTHQQFLVAWQRAARAAYTDWLVLNNEYIHTTTLAPVSDETWDLVTIYHNNLCTYALGSTEPASTLPPTDLTSEEFTGLGCPESCISCITFDEPSSLNN